MKVTSLFRLYLLLLLFAFLPSSVWGDDESTFLSAFQNATWTTVGEGKAAYTKLNFADLFGHEQRIAIVRYRERDLQTQLVANEGNGVAKRTSEAGEASQAVVAINGSYFDNERYEKETYRHTAEPMWISPSTEVKELDTFFTDHVNACNAFVMFKKDGSIHFQPYASYSAKVQKWKNKYSSFIATGPMLRSKGKNSPVTVTTTWYTGSHSRSMIGITRNHTIYMAVLNGEGASITHWQSIARWMGLTDAINLDGGGSSTLWTKDYSTLNKAVVKERIVPTVIVGKPNRPNKPNRAH